MRRMQLERHGLVPANVIELFWSQLAGLVQHVIRNDELADVVHERRVMQTFEAAGLETELHPDQPRVPRDPLRHGRPCSGPLPPSA